MSLIALRLNCCTVSFYINKNQIQQSCIHETFTGPCEKSKTVSFASSVINNIVVFPALSKSAVKLI